jgi:hypothetical protein
VRSPSSLTRAVSLDRWADGLEQRPAEIKTIIRFDTSGGA